MAVVTIEKNATPFFGGGGGGGNCGQRRTDLRHPYYLRLWESGIKTFHGQKKECNNQ